MVEGFYRVAGFGGFTLNHALEETHLGIARFAGQVGVGLGQCLGELLGADQEVDVAVVVGMGGKRGK